MLPFLTVLLLTMLSLSFPLRLPQGLVVSKLYNGNLDSNINIQRTAPSFKLLTFRGGKKTSKKETISSKVIAKTYSIAKYISQTYQQMLPITKSYFTLALLCTVVSMLGAPGPLWFSLDILKFYEIWRPVTTVAFFGSPSISMANDLYLLARYGQVLETFYGSSIFAWFLITQISILSVLGYLLGFKFLAHSMITSIIYVASRMQPFEKISYMFGIIIESWQQPYVMMLFDCLLRTSLSAAWPHILGILAGHTYLFFTDIWPRLGGRKILEAPSVVINSLDHLVANGMQGSGIFQQNMRSRKKHAAANSRSRSSTNDNDIGDSTSNLSRSNLNRSFLSRSLARRSSINKGKKVG